MQSVRKRLSIILIVCTISAALISALFVNVIMNSTFNKYMQDIQNKRYESIVQYFEQVYKKEGKWTSSSGQEMMHEAYMSNYCLTLMDTDKNVIWGMNSNDIRKGIYTMMGSKSSKGVYTSKTFAIDVNKKTVGYVMVGQYQAVLLSQQDINFKKSINAGIGASAFIIIVAAVLVSLKISKQFSHPIKEVCDTSVELSNGNYKKRSDTKSSIAEINTLIKNINALGEKLDHQDTLRKRLVSDISHEIRTPLNVLQNNLEAMIDGVLPITDERLNNLNEEVKRFGKLLNNLNSLKQFEVEDVELNMTSLSLGDLVKDVCSDFDALAKEKKIKINLQIENNKAMVLGDADKLRQVFINLMSNAVKFNRENGSIWVELKENNDKAIVKIKDNGIGIKKDDLPYIFERLYRGDKSRNLTQGSGIGLTIVKRILDIHKASIEVESTENLGTTFTICFNKLH